MKKLFFIPALFLLTGIAFGQTPHKGAIVVISNYEMTLKPDVSMDQFLDFYVNKFLPEFEKNYPGIKVYLLNGDRGENKYKIGEMMICESVEIRDKYWPTENGENSEAAKAAEAKMTLINQEVAKFVVDAKRTYTDWIIK